MDVSRGRRGGSWQRVSRACVCRGVSRGGRGTPDARARLRGRWAVDSLGTCGEWWPWEVPRACFRVTGVGIRARGVRFTWPALGSCTPHSCLRGVERTLIGDMACSYFDLKWAQCPGCKTHTGLPKQIAQQGSPDSQDR